MAEQLKVTQDDKLLNFLFLKLQGWSKNKIKERLKKSSIAVNGETTTQYDFALKSGDIVSIGVVQKHFKKVAIKSLEIIYQDKEIIAINKPAGLLSVGTTKETKEHALALLRKQLSRPKKMVQLWPVHRLDRETSGILLFATSKESREKVMAKWKEAEKTYLAIVKGIPSEDKRTISEPLRLDENEYFVHVGEHPYAKEAITHYHVIKSKNSRSLLEVTIDTGRQHQIRAHLSWIKNPIIGDERYGVKGLRLGLHATKLVITHPTSHRSLSFNVDAPKDFYALLD